MDTSADDASWTQLSKRLNASGIPFQLAVENFLREQGPKHHFTFLGHEIPWKDGYLDILLQNNNFVFLAIECKKVEEETWIFVRTEKSSQTRCRLEWYNPRLPDPMPIFPAANYSKVFCSEFNMVEGSPESEFCILPKGGTNKILEPLANEIVDACRDILDDTDRAHDENHWEVLVPVIVTNARLVTCEFSPGKVDLATGGIQLHDSNFSEVPFVRFRKTLVSFRSDPTSRTPINVASWIADRERTVFVVGAANLDQFMHGFRSFSCQDEGGNPKEWSNPPSGWRDSLSR